METNTAVQTEPLETLIAKHRDLKEAALSAFKETRRARWAAMKIPLNHIVSWPDGERVAIFDDPKIMAEFDLYRRKDSVAARAELDRYMAAAKAHAARTGVLDLIEIQNQARRAEEQAFEAIAKHRPGSADEAKAKADYLAALEAERAERGMSL